MKTLLLQKFSGIATAMMAAMLIAAPAPAPARADCGDPGQDPCNGPVPSVDQAVAIMAELTDPNIPAVNKTDIVTLGFTPEEAQKIDCYLDWMNRHGCLPFNFVVTDIQSAPNNFAGATVAVPNGWCHTGPGPIVLVDQGGHWLLTHHSAVNKMLALYEIVRPLRSMPWCLL